MAEWLGRGLQNLVQRFESASDLNAVRDDGVFFMWILSNERFFVRILPMVTSRVYFRTALCATAALGR